MVEMEILYHLSMVVGFLIAAFLFLLIGAAVAGIHCLSKSATKELEGMIDRLNTMEEDCMNEYKNG